MAGLPLGYSWGVPAWHSHLSILQGSILQALLSADLKGVWHFPTMEAAGGCRQGHWQDSPVLPQCGLGWQTGLRAPGGSDAGVQLRGHEGWAVRGPLVLGVISRVCIFRRGSLYTQRNAQAPPISILTEGSSWSSTKQVEKIPSFQNIPSSLVQGPPRREPLSCSSRHSWLCRP